MLNRRTTMDSAREPGAPSHEGGGQLIDLMVLVEVLKRQWSVIVLCVGIAIGAGLLYIASAAPRYTASVLVMIDTRRNQLLQGQRVVGDQQLDAGFVESQVEVIKSDSVSLSVVRELKLLDDPAFGGGTPGLVARVVDTAKSVFGADVQSSASVERRENAIVKALSSRTQARRTGLTYVIQISYTDGSQERAARIANGIADAYMVGELEARYQATRRASRWLQERIKELRDQATNAELAVQKFRSENNIIDTGRGLMTEQQLSDLNSQLAAARAATAEARARLDRIVDIENNEIPDGTVVDALRSDVITRLRAQYLDLSARESAISRQYGATHSAAANLRNQMTEIRRSMRDQLRQISETYKSEFEIARSRERSLQESMTALIDQVGANSPAVVKLKDLESSAQASRNLYDTFLQRFMESTQQQTIPISEARVISPAAESPNKTWPKTPLILAVSVFMGFGIGFFIAWAREMLSRQFRTSNDVERVLGIECLGILPKVGEAASGEGAQIGSTADHDPIRYAIDHPLSRFAEVLRNTKVAIDVGRLTRDVKVIGIVSALPNEGKSTIAANLGHLLAQAKYRVLLIDGDLRNPSLSRSMCPNAHAGLLQALANPSNFQQLTVKDPTSGLAFLPTVIRGRLAQSAELLSSPAMSQLLDRARQEFDYVLIDLAPITPVIDVKAICPMTDALVGVVEWGQTGQQAVREAFESSEQIRDRLIGVILNKADPVMLKRIESYKGRYYNNYYLEKAPA